MRTLILGIITLTALLHATTVSALRDDEKAYLERLQNKKSSSGSMEDDADYADGPSGYSEIKKIEQCQAILKKIDKYSLEIMQLEKGYSVQHNEDNSTNTAGVTQKKITINAGSIDEQKKLTNATIKSLKSQIARYKTQAKEYCEAKYLRNSYHMKSKGAVKRK